MWATRRMIPLEPVRRVARRVVQGVGDCVRPVDLSGRCNSSRRRVVHSRPRAASSPAGPGDDAASAPTRPTWVLDARPPVVECQERRWTMPGVDDRAPPCAETGCNVQTGRRVAHGRPPLDNPSRRSIDPLPIGSSDALPTSTTAATTTDTGHKGANTYCLDVTCCGGPYRAPASTHVGRPVAGRASCPGSRPHSRRGAIGLELTWPGSNRAST